MRKKRGERPWFDPAAGHEIKKTRRTASATGAILADHVKSSDWKARRAEKLGHCTNEVIDEVRARLAPLLGYGSHK